MARIHLQRGPEEDIYAAIRELRFAKELAGALIDSTKTDPETVDTATEVYGASSNLLANYDRAGAFGMLTLMAGYDTNVLAVPSSQIAVQTTGADSVTTALQAGFGYSSSPAADYQYVPSYRLSFNFNLNEATKLGDFLVHDFSLYVTRKALARTSFGLRTEAIVTFQNQTDASNNSAFKPYSYSFPIGPFFKAPLPLGDGSWSVGGELVASYHHDYGDDTASSDQKRTGTDFTARLSVTSDAKSRFWNPTFTLSGVMALTSGTEYDATTAGAELRDQIKITDSIDSYVSAGVTLTTYPSRLTGRRTDQLALLGASLVDRISPSWSLLGTLQVYRNLSNLDATYGYSRLAVSAGATYSF
jgi:hypothetical protein